MTPQEKADDLLSKFLRLDNSDEDAEHALDDAKFCVNEIIEEIIQIDIQLNESRLLNNNLRYWLEVKKEIELYDPRTNN
jgi:hypothetical protein